MCGIAGIVSQAPVVDRDRLTAMRDTMTHRGPDAAGLWCSEDRRIGLAHRRLAIIDSSPAGEQPMLDPSGDCRIVFNGEIYNYLELRAELEREGVAFHTASDTEVLLAAYRQWDVDCLSRLNGMFAFALFDRRVNRLLLARDRAGEKPLFYRRDGSTIAFASELKALMADPDCPRRLDPDALDHYLAFGYVPDDMCLLAGVHKLPQGHALVYDLQTGAARTWCYWQLPDADGAPIETAALVDELDRLLLDSVRLRLIADVPVGIMLSGGLDSSLVTAMAARVASGRVKTFNVSFPGHRGYDEGPYARIVAQHFGTDHVEMAAEPATVDLLPRLARQYHEPIADSSMVPTYLVSQMIRREATVALGGDGGDGALRRVSPSQLVAGAPTDSPVSAVTTAPCRPPPIRAPDAVRDARPQLPAGAAARRAARFVQIQPVLRCGDAASSARAARRACGHARPRRTSGPAC